VPLLSVKSFSVAVGSAERRLTMIFWVLEMMTLKDEPSWAPIVEAVSSRKWNLRFERRKLAYSGGTTRSRWKVWISFSDWRTVLSGAKTRAFLQKRVSLLNLLA